MDEKHRISGFKALLDSHKTNFSHLPERDGSFRLWRDLSSEGRLENIVRDATFYDVPFEEFVQAVRASVDSAAIEEAALRLAMRSGRELHHLEMLFPDDGQTGPPPLVERVRELLNADSPEQEGDQLLTGKEMTILLEELRADEAAGKREDAHYYGMEDLRKIIDEKAKIPATEKGKEQGIER